MKKQLIILLVLVLVIGGGAAAFLLTKEDEPKSSTTQQSSGDFSPASIQELDFVATITTEGSNENTQGTLEKDGDKTRLVSTADNQTSEIINTPDALYTCTNGVCYKFAAQNSESGVDVSQYHYEDTEISNLRNTAVYKGQKDCASGKCDVWEVKDTPDSVSELYLDVNTKRIIQVVSTKEGTTTKITYEYKDVTVDIPTNVQQIPVTQ